MANYFVVKDPNGGWNVKTANAQRSSFHSDNQKPAESEAKRFAGNSGGGEVRIQGRDGRFRDSDTVPPANDPFPPRDKKH
jgi:hypothetical protein